uniref:Peptidase family M13 n=1 Tax=Musca domestica TaxID=7370 RepID=T1PHY4_MUSDO
MLVKRFVVYVVIVTLPLACGFPENELFQTPMGKELLKRSKAADIKSWMDASHNPCGDFYHFACANWKRINSAQLFGDYATDQFHDMLKLMEAKILDFLSDPRRGAVVEDKLKDFYESCLRVHWNDSGYLEALRSVYGEYGEFSFLKVKPVIRGLGDGEEGKMMEGQNQEVEEFNWWSTVAKIKNTYGLAIILSVDVLKDLNNANQTMVYLGPPNFERNPTAANPIDQLQDVRLHVLLQQYLGLDKDSAKQVAKWIMNFDILLSQSYTDKHEGKSKADLLTLYNVSDLNEEFQDYFDVEKFLQLTLGTENLPAQVYVYDKKYFEKSLQIIKATDSAIVEDYILWSLLKDFIIYGKQRAPKKWCVARTKKYFSKSLEHYIYQQYRSEQYEKEVYELWNEIKATFHDSLKGDKYYWMGQSTREHAMEKLDKMNLTINSHDNENFQEFFKDLIISPHNYVANIQAILKHIESLRPNKLEVATHDLENEEIMSFTPTYSEFSNAIQVPVALLQPYRLWHPLYPKAIKYGTLGFLLAHEMIHGFDDEGRVYDAHGNAVNWWDEKSAYEFESRRRCFQAQYHNYTYGGRLLPNSRRQSENIADNAGIRLAYTAYVRWLEREKPTNANIEREDVLPNLDYNNRELFFISFAQLWCEDVQTLFRSYLAFSDVHAPSMYRVIGSLSNFHDFSWIFRCDMKPETPMNPSLKCELY